MTRTEVEQRLQEGLQQVAKLEDRDIEDIRQDAIRDYLIRRGISLLQDLASTSPGAELSDSEAMEIANNEIRALRRERRA